MLIALSVLSYSNGKPIEDESETVVSQGVASDAVESEADESKAIEIIDNEVIDNEVNLEEVGNYFEGDMIMSSGEIRRLFSKTGIVDTRKRWLKVGNQVIVPYTFRAGSYSKNE